MTYLEGGRRWIIAVGLFAVCALPLMIIIGRIAPHYFPILDEWSLLAHSGWSSQTLGGWFGQGFADYFGDYGSICQSGTYFLRPVFNLSYAVLSTVLSSGGALYFSGLLIALACALAYLCATQGLHGRGVAAVALALCVPLLPSVLGCLPIFYAPCLIYDVLAAVLCLGAYLCYGAGRFALCSVLVLAAVFTKETALPAAVAFPLAYLFAQARPLLSSHRPRLVLLMLASPVLLWLLSRWLAFGGVLNSAYVLMHGHSPWFELLKRMLSWPWWLDQYFFSRTSLLGSDWAPRALLLANVLSVISICYVLLRQCWRRQALDLTLLIAILSYAFMAIAGTASRYGFMLQVFLLVAAARLLISGAARWPAYGLCLAVALGVTVTVQEALRDAPRANASLQKFYDVSRRYVAVLHGFKSGERVLVLNDPSTRFSRLGWLLKVENLDLDAAKATDLAWGPWPDLFNGSCSTTLMPTAQPLSYEFTQTCGFEIACFMSTPASVHDIQLNPWATLHLPALAQAGQTATPWGQSFGISLKRGNVNLVYYDPATDRFITYHVP